MAVTMDEITSYADTLTDLISQAKTDFLGRVDRLYYESSRQTVADLMRITFEELLDRYGMPAAELGAQWYELCASKGGAEVEAALLSDLNFERMDRRLQRRLKKYLNGEEDLDVALEYAIELLEDEIRMASRDQIMQNLDRDEKANRRLGRGERRAGFARVPVGDTCAWCLMLASRGYVYRSYESAGGLDPDHFHPHCDCVVVGYNDPVAIYGYGDRYKEYEAMYSAARSVYETGEMSSELAERIARAKEEHNRKYENGELSTKWSSGHEIAIILREQNNLEH